MIHFHFGQRDTFFLTLAERVTLPSPVFIFEFACRVPNQVVRIALLSEANSSRCERFTIDTDIIFPDHDAGQYKYRVYEAPAPVEGQEVTVDMDQLRQLENGIMVLHRTPAEVIAHSTDNRFYQPYSRQIIRLTTEGGKIIITEDEKEITL